MIETTTQPARKCRPHWEDWALWERFVTQAPKQTLYEEIGHINRVQHSLFKKQIPGGDRLQALADMGGVVYEHRFGEPWFPF